MKTKEFIERLASLGYSTTKYEDTIEVLEMFTPKHGRIYGRIHRKEPYRIETTQYARQDPRLFDLMVEYARTPIDDREEPKKYYVKPKGIKVHRERVYTYISIQKTWELLRKDIDYEWQNIFTLDELKELGVPIEHYDLEEVKE